MLVMDGWIVRGGALRRTTKDCDFSEGENIERLQKCLQDPAKNCVRMILLTNNAQKAIEKNYGGFDNIIE
jgi:hypothetical protein